MLIHYSKKNYPSKFDVQDERLKVAIDDAKNALDDYLHGRDYDSEPLAFLNRSIGAIALDVAMENEAHVDPLAVICLREALSLPEATDINKVTDDAGRCALRLGRLKEIPAEQLKPLYKFCSNLLEEVKKYPQSVKL